jgi:hypothetical protein
LYQAVQVTSRPSHLGQQAFFIFVVVVVVVVENQI